MNKELESTWVNSSLPIDVFVRIYVKKKHQEQALASLRKIMVRERLDEVNQLHRQAVISFGYETQWIKEIRDKRLEALYGEEEL